MASESVVVERLNNNGRTVWCVRLGKRAVTFTDEAAARAFAAQLHMRVNWLGTPNQR